MKLISLNMEGERHVEHILPFLAAEAADVVCLMESPQLFQHHLNVLGYQTSFVPNLIRERRGLTLTEGLTFASRTPHTTSVEYYHGTPEMVSVYQGKEETVANPVLIGRIDAADGPFTIATTHVMVTKHGLPDEHQRTGIGRLLQLMQTYEPHVLCGDFNMPRGYNELYEEVTQRYHDAVPPEYASSLDRDLHRLGNDPHLTDPIFDAFMVDYVFTQPPYTADDVSLRFGVSDHAAVVAHVGHPNR